MKVGNIQKNRVIPASERLAQQEGFTRVPDEILFHPDISAKAKLVWVAFWSFCYGPESEIFPGMKGISEKLDMSPNTVRKYRKELEEQGLLITKRQGQGKTNRYYLYSPSPESIGKEAQTFEVPEPQGLADQEPQTVADQEPQGVADPVVQEDEEKENTPEGVSEADDDEFRNQQKTIAQRLHEETDLEKKICWGMAGKWINLFGFKRVDNVLKKLVAGNKLSDLDGDVIPFVAGCLSKEEQTMDEHGEIDGPEDLPSDDTLLAMEESQCLRLLEKAYPDSEDPMVSHGLSEGTYSPYGY